MNNRESYLNLGGTFRSVTSANTIARLKPLLRSLGITRVANVTGLDCIDIPVAVCIRPNSKHLAVSQGKGLSWELAWISAVMESIEGYHAENAKAPIVEGTYSTLKKHYPLISPQYFLQGLFKIPRSEDWSMGWSEAEDIVSDKIVLIPHALSCLDSTITHPEYSFFNVSSNGLAAGNTLDEAKCHALYEIIERDALYHWAKLSVEERLATQIKLDSITSALNKELIAKILAVQQFIKIWEITSKLGIPTYHCVIVDTDPLRNLGLFSGTGTHLNKEVALSRAITEAAQSRLTLISGSRDDVFNDHYHKKATFQYPNKIPEGMRNFEESLPLEIPATFAEHFAFMIDTLCANNFKQLFTVNHTKEAFKIPVVHLFVPGMKYNGRRI